jgi:1,4-alpha-glucan branching enzyme
VTAPEAAAVAVAGTFNDWDPRKTPMTNGKDGTWKVRVSLPPSR